MTKEALDTGDEDEKEEAQGAPKRFRTAHQVVEGSPWRSAASKGMMDIGGESRARTIGQSDEGSL